MYPSPGATGCSYTGRAGGANVMVKLTCANKAADMARTSTASNNKRRIRIWHHLARSSLRLPGGALPLRVPWSEKGESCMARIPPRVWPALCSSAQFAEIFSTRDYRRKKARAPGADPRQRCELPLLHGSGRNGRRGSNSFAGNDKLHSPVLLASRRILIRGYRGTVAEAFGADGRSCNTFLDKIIPH